MKIKYIGFVGTRNLKFFQRVTLGRVPFTNYIVSNCSWTSIDSKKAVMEITLEETSNVYVVSYTPMIPKRISVYKRMGVLDLIWLGWIYLRRER